MDYSHFYRIVTFYGCNLTVLFLSFGDKTFSGYFNYAWFLPVLVRIWYYCVRVIEHESGNKQENVAV
jgi:hypothetical protein